MQQTIVTMEEKLTFSIPVFCKLHDISMGTYYNLRERGEQPREMRVGKRVMISVEAAADWRRDRERHHKQHVAKERAIQRERQQRAVL